MAAAAERAQVLVAGGYGDLIPWLLADPSPAERDAMQARQEAQQAAMQQAVDLFD